MTPDEVDILVAALDDCQDLVRKFARLRHPQMDRSYFGEIELLKHLSTAASLLQDYQKLRERVSVEKIEKMIRKPFIIKRDMQELGYSSKGTVDYISWRDDIGEWGIKNLAQAIVTYLQQPTEPR